MTTVKALDQMLGRPSFSKAAVCSLILHASVISATYCWWSRPASEFSLAGARSIVQVEPVAAEFRPSGTKLHGATEVVWQEADPSRAVVRSVPALTSVLKAPIAAAELPLLRRKATLADRPVDAGFPDVELEAVPHAVASRRLTSAGVAGPHQQGPSPMPRRVAKSPSFKASVAIEKLAGTADREPPDLSGNRPPTYPTEAIRRGLEGTVLLRLHIGFTGQVDRVEIVRSSGHAILDRAAVDAVRSWHGRPAFRAGRPVATVELLPVRFSF